MLAKLTGVHLISHADPNILGAKVYQNFAITDDAVIFFIGQGIWVYEAAGPQKVSVPARNSHQRWPDRSRWLSRAACLARWWRSARLGADRAASAYSRAAVAQVARLLVEVRRGCGVAGQVGVHRGQGREPGLWRRRPRRSRRPG